MKPLLTTIIILGLLACNGRKQTARPEPAKTDSSVTIRSSIIAKDSIEVPDSLPSFSYDSEVYDEYLPADLKSYLGNNLPDWKLPDPSEWDNLWFQAYKSPSSLVNYVSGDFNCDQKRDYAVLLSDKRNSISAWVIQSGKSGYSSNKLEDFGEFDNHIQIGLELVEPGDLNYIDPEVEDEPKPINLKCQAVQITFFEKAATTFYWDGDKFNTVQTGD